MMPFTSLPPEIVQMIYGFLPGADIFKCRGVCRQWRDAIDLLPEGVWQKLVTAELRANKNDIELKKAGLTWRQMLKSIILWQDVKHATVTVRKYPLDYDHISDFQVLKGGVIGVLQDNNQLVYYDTDYKEIRRECYDFFVTGYKENDHMIVLLKYTSCVLCIIPKKGSGKHFVVGKVHGAPPFSIMEFGMYETEVFFVDPDNMMHVSKLVDEDGDVNVITEHLGRYDERPVAFSQRLGVNTGEVIYLSMNGKIVKCAKRGFEEVDELDKVVGFHKYMDDFDINWTSKSVLSWLKHIHMDQLSEALTKLRYSSIHCHGSVLLIATEDNKIHIYHDSHANGQIMPSKIGADCVIDLSKYTDDDDDDSYSSPGSIFKMFIFELVNGHRIVAMSLDDVFSIDIMHLETGSKLKYPSPIKIHSICRKPVSFNEASSSDFKAPKQPKRQSRWQTFKNFIFGRNHRRLD